MPEPTKFSKPRRPDEGGSTQLSRIVSQEIVEERCHVCTSPYRRAIDRMLAMGTGYTEISRVFNNEIDRRSISNHDKKHLGIEDAAVRRIIEHEMASAQESVEDGIQGAVARRVYLQTALQKAMEALVTGDATIEPKDAVNIIQLLEKLDTQTEGAQVEELKRQVTAYMQSMKEICPPEMWGAIVDRTNEILGVGPKQIEP